MCRPIIDLVKWNDIVVVFDVDGVLAPYEWEVSNMPCRMQNGINARK